MVYKCVGNNLVTYRPLPLISEAEPTSLASFAKDGPCSRDPCTRGRRDCGDRGDRAREWCGSFAALRGTVWLLNRLWYWGTATCARMSNKKYIRLHKIAFMHFCGCQSSDNFEIVVVFLRDLQRLATLHRCCCIRHIASLLCNGCCVVSILSFRSVCCFILFFLSIGPFLLLFREATAKGSHERRELRLSSKTVYLKSIHTTAHLKAVIKDFLWRVSSNTLIKDCLADTVSKDCLT